MEYIAALKI